MSHSTMKFIKGLGLGMMAGAAAGIAGCCYLKRHRKGFKRNMSRALRNMSDLVDSMNGMF